MLPKPKKKKIIDEKNFVRNARKVKKYFEEMEKFVMEKKLKYGDRNSSGFYRCS